MCPGWPRRARPTPLRGVGGDGGVILVGDNLVAPQTPDLGPRQRAGFHESVGPGEGGVGLFGPRRRGRDVMAQSGDARVELANAPFGELLRLLRQLVQVRLGQSQLARQLRPLVFEGAELAAQIVEAAAIGLVVADAEHGRALVRRPRLEFLRRRPPRRRRSANEPSRSES